MINNYPLTEITPIVNKEPTPINITDIRIEENNQNFANANPNSNELINNSYPLLTEITPIVDKELNNHPINMTDIRIEENNQNYAVTIAQTDLK